MPYLETSQEWMKQSSLLLQARPTTTIITTKYSILGLKNSKIQKRKRKQDGKDGSATASASAAAGTASNPATITLKTWDPLSGACLKYQTNKAAEVGRLISALGKLARTMAALPEIPGVTETPALEAQEQTKTADTMPTISAVKETKTTAPPAAGGGGGKKKNKKGKK